MVVLWYTVVHCVSLCMCKCMPAEVTDNSDAYLVMSNQVYIHQLSLDGSRVQTIISHGLSDTRAIDFHYRYI